MHFSFGVQSRITICFYFWCLEPLFVFHLAFSTIVRLSFGVQSHYSFSVWRSEPLFHSGVQSRTFSLAFRAIIRFLFWRLEPLHCFILAFRVIVRFPLGVQSHCFFSVSVFRAINIFSFDVQSHYFFSVSAFRAIDIFHLVFRAIIVSQL